MNVRLSRLPSSGLRFIVMATLVLTLSGLAVPLSHAQGTIRANISGIPPVLSTPLIGEIDQNVRQGRYTTQVIYQNPSGEPVEVGFRVTLRYEGELIAEMWSQSVTYQPGTYLYRTFDETPEVRFGTSGQDLGEQVRQRLRRHAVRSGVLPEGEYVVEIEPKLVRPDRPITPIPGIARTTVRYPQPPTLISPADGATVTAGVPVFSWTPVDGTPGDVFDYDLLIVEVRPGQTPLQAIEANRPVTGRRPVTLQQTTFSYTRRLPPLEERQTYAWQVRARETANNVPLRDEGETPIHTFTYGQESAQQPFAEVSSIPLAPDFASLTELEDLDVRTDGSTYILNGSATLQLAFLPRSQPVTTTVEVDELRVETSDPTVLRGGFVTGSAPDTVPGDSLGLLSPQSIQWSMDEGVTLRAQLHDPSDEAIDETGTLRLRPGGPHGTVRVTGNPITRFRADPLTVDVTELRAQFPQQTLQATGELHAFGKRTGCTIDPLGLGPRRTSAVVDCAMQAEIPLAADTSVGMQVEVRSLQGELDAHWGDDALEYDLTADAAVQLHVANTEPCGARAILDLTSKEGATLRETTSNCPVPTPRMDLGLADLLVQDLRLDVLRYQPVASWDARLTASAAAELVPFGNARLPVMENLSITQEGIEVPSVSYGVDDLTQVDPFTAEGVEMDLQAFSASATTVPWQSSNRTPTRSPWPFSVDLNLRFPNFSQAIPACLRDASITISGAQVENSTFSAPIPTMTLEDCHLPLPPGPAALTFDQIGGRLQVTSGDQGPKLDPTLRLGSALKAAPPVLCEEKGMRTIPLGDGALTMDTAQGLFDEQTARLKTNCRLSLGPLAAEMTDLSVELDPSNDEHNLFLEGTATIELEDGPTASGPFRLNVRTGRFVELDIQIDDPFELGIPRDNPALVFRLEQARLTPEGLLVNGRHELVLPQTTIGATFDDVRMGLASRRIESGIILIDYAFGFSAAVDGPTQELSLQAVGDSSTTASPGLYFGLSGTPQIDSTGLTLQGTSTPAKATIDVPALQQTSGLEAVLSDSFSVGLAPFGVNRGRVTFRRTGTGTGTTIGYADRDGLHLSPLLAAGALPAKIPLPSTDVAYLRLKDGQGNLLVQAETQSNGHIQLSTIANQPPELVLPGLQGAQAQPPRLPVSLNQFTIDAANGTYVSGTLTASVPQGHRLRDLPSQGIPLALREVRFGSEQIAGAQREALFLSGGLSLFDTSLKVDTPEHHVTFYVETGPTAEAQIHLQNLAAQVPVAGSGQVAIDVASVTGSATIPLGESGSPSFDFQVEGQFTLRTAGGNEIAQADIQLTYERSTGAGGPRLTMGSVQTTSLPDPDAITVGPYKLGVPSIESLSLSYDAAQQELGFSASLDTELTFVLPSDSTFTVPLRHVTLSDDGFMIPTQSVNASSVPGLSLPRIPLGPVDIEPLALRTSVEAQFDWFGGGSFSLNPKLDLAVYLPSFHGTNPGPPEGVTISDVEFTNGTLSGSVSYTSQTPVQIPLGPPSAQPPELKISKIDAELRGEAPGPVQEVDVDIDAELVPGTGPLHVASPGQCPAPTTFTLSLVEGPGLAGQVQSTDPCGRLEWGPVTLELTEAALDFAFAENTQQLIATGSVEATFPNATDTQSDVSVTGTNVSVDLIEGQITNGVVAVNTPIRVPVPLGASNPLLTFQVGTPGGARPVATLDDNGLEIGQVSGQLDLDPGTADVAFNNLRFRLDPDENFPITQGTATIGATVAAEAAFNPLGWTLVDTSSSFTRQAGARLSLDSDVTLSEDGLTFNGGGEAEAHIAGQQFASLRLGFQNDFTVDTQPAHVTGGRANLYLDEGTQPASDPLLYFDSTGVHTTAGGAVQAMIPDTLALPTKDVAYLVLRDENGTLLVDSSQTSSGDVHIQTQSGAPVELVVAALDENDNPPSVDVSFGTTMDDAGNVSVDSLGLVFDGTLDVGPDFPFRLKHASYKRTEPTPFEVQAEIDLPPVLEPGQPLSVALSVGPNGFKGRAQSGTYAETHSSDLEQQAPVAEIQHPDASNAKLTVKVRGIDFQFGSEPSQHTYQISGDFQTPLLATQDASGQTPMRVHYAGSYSSSSQSWSFTGTANHIQGDLPMGVGRFDPNQMNGIVVAASNSEFSLELNGVFSVPDVLEDFAVTVNSMKVGLERQNQQTKLLASVGSAQVSGGQQIQLFGGALDLAISQSSLSLQENPFVVTATVSGDLTFLRPDKTVQFSDLTVRSDGQFSAGNVQVNDLDIIDQHLTLKTLAFSQPSGTEQVQVDATVEATLPDPVSSTAEAEITVERTSGGQVTARVDGPTFALDEGEYKIGNNPATEVELGSFATFDLTGIGVDLNVAQPARTPALYATASMYLDNNTSKRLDFGDAARIEQNPGIRMTLEEQGGSYVPDVEYNVTAQASRQNPLFEFNTGTFLRVTLTDIRLSGGTDDPMQVALGGSAGISVPGVIGSVAYEGFTVGKTGIVDEGQLAGGGSFGLLPREPGSSDPKPVFTLDVGTFETTRTTASVSYEEHTGQQSSSGKPTGSVESTSVQVDRYLRFYNKSGPDADAIGLSVDVGKQISGGGIGEVLFYETTQGEVVARVKDASLDLKATSVNASILYSTVGGGFQLDVAGEATLGGDGLDDVGKRAVVVGTVGISPQEELRLGLFAAVEGAGLPILPGLIELDGLGAGFFLRPKQAQLEQVDDAVSLSDKEIITAKRSEIQSNSNNLLTVKVFGAAGVLGSQGSYVMRGQAMLTISNAYSMVEVRVAPNLPGVDGGEALSLIPVSKFEQSAILGVEWTATPSVSGAAYAVLQPIPVATMTVRAAFYAEPGPDDWAVYSAGTRQSNVNKPGVEIDLLALITIGEGKFVLSPDGFYAELGTNITLPPSDVSTPVRVKGGFDLQAWDVPNQAMGAYVEAAVKVDAKLATVVVNGKGAYLTEGGTHLIYGYGAADVPAGRVHGHVAIYNGTVESGLGKSDRYENMIDDARNQAESMATNADDAAQRVEDLRNAATIPEPAELATSAEDKVQAGVALHSRNRSERTLWADTVPHQPPFVLSFQYAPLKTIPDVVKEDRPDSTAAHQARQTMNQELDDLRTLAPDVQTHLRGANTDLAGITSDHRQQAASLSSPVQNTQLAPATDADGNVTQRPSFTVNEGQAQTNASELGGVQVNHEELNERYQTALVSALTDLKRFDRIANGASVGDYEGVAQELGISQTVQDALDQAVVALLPSISDLGQQYKAAATAVNEHYAKRIDYLRRRQDAYASARSTLHNRLGNSGQAVEKEVESSMNGSPAFGISTGLGESNCQSTVGIIASRYYHVELLATGSTQEASQRWQDVMDGVECGNLTSSDVANLQQIWMESGMELWWEIHDLGLQELESASTVLLRDEASAYASKTQELDDAHGRYTRSVDRFYALKAELTTLAYGMAREYARWRRQTGLETSTATESNDEDLSTDLSQTLNDLVASLEPPEITDLIALTSQQGDYYSHTDVMWGTSSGSTGGDVREISVDVNETETQSNAAIDQMNFRTIGDDEVGTLSHYGVQTDYESSGTGNASSYPEELTKGYGFGLRARGNGGNTAARVGNFEVPVHPNSPSTGATGPIMSADHTPPTQPSVQPKITHDQDTETGAVYAERTPGYGWTDIEAYWAADSSTVRLVVHTRDRESDVTTIEYAVGSQEGTTDRKDWTEVPGIRLQGGPNQSTVNWHQRITIRDLSLRETTPTYLSLRATNGAGLTSSPQAVSEPFYHDPTPPVVDPTQVTATTKRYVEDPSDLRWEPAYQQKKTSVAQTDPEWNDPEVNSAGGKDQVEMAVTAPADDPSGIYDQEFHVLDQRVPPEEAFNRSTACSSPCVSPGANKRERRIDWNSTGASFSDTLYVYVRTRNYARKSTIMEVPISPGDRSRPTTPTVRLRQHGSTFYLTQLSGDRESDVVGYQYAVSTTEYGTDVRSWPSRGVDFTAEPPSYTSPTLAAQFVSQTRFSGGTTGGSETSSSEQPQVSPPPSVSIPSSEIPSSGPYFVTVRAVNGDGDVSEPVTSGPATDHDPTSPLTPSVSTSYNTDRLALSIEAENVGDPESGVVSVQWSVHDLVDPDRLIEEGRFRPTNRGLQPFSVREILTLGSSQASNVASYGYRVEVTVENGAGMTRTATTNRVSEPINTWSSQTQDLWKNVVTLLWEDGRTGSTIIQVARDLNLTLDSVSRIRVLTQLLQLDSQDERADLLQKITQDHIPSLSTDGPTLNFR